MLELLCAKFQALTKCKMLYVSATFSRASRSRSSNPSVLIKSIFKFELNSIRAFSLMRWSLRFSIWCLIVNLRSRIFQRKKKKNRKERKRTGLLPLCKAAVIKINNKQEVAHKNNERGVIYNFYLEEDKAGMVIR